MPGSNKSLMLHYKHRVDIPLLLLASSVLLIIGLSLPILKMEKFLFWEDQYTIITGFTNLYEEGNQLLALLILFFSIIFPISKLIALSVAWFFRFSDKVRKKILKLMEILGHWSMLDVFVVAVIIVIAKSSWYSDAEAQPGLYYFGSAIILSMITTFLIKGLAKKI